MFSRLSGIIKRCCEVVIFVTPIPVIYIAREIEGHPRIGFCLRFIGNEFPIAYIEMF